MTGTLWKPAAWLTLLGLTCSVFGACNQDVPTSATPPVPEAVIPGDPSTDVVAYAQLCKEAMGLGDAVLPPMNCLDGVEVPITVDGEPLDEDTYTRLAAGEIGCDTPSWFPGFECQNYAFVQRQTLAPDVEAVLICRSREWRDHRDLAARRAAYEANPTIEGYRRLFTFDSFGLIWSHTQTGQTCFFDYVGEIYGGHVPSPDDPTTPTLDQLPEPPPPAAMVNDPDESEFWARSARDTWHRPIDVALTGSCAACHDSGPFIETPWLRDLNVIPTIAPTVPYTVVGELFSIWNYLLHRYAVSTLPVPRPDGSEQAQVCTSCHRIGGAETCNTLIHYAVGDIIPPGTAAPHTVETLAPLMPPPPAEWRAMDTDAHRAAWEAQYRDHFDMLTCCCENLGALGCTYQRLWFDPLGEPDAGPGPTSCYPEWFEPQP